MRRADRLFQIVQQLRGRRLTTAAQLAKWLAVSERTIYRDISDLALSGVPVEGEAGVGYRLARGFDLPPIMFTFDELEALIAGARMIETWGGPSLAAHSRSALAKITLALPAGRREEVEKSRMFAAPFGIRKEEAVHLETIRLAIGAQNRLDLCYVDEKSVRSQRTIRPLGLFFWGAKWTLVAWCELKNDFRSFRTDRIEAVSPLDTFVEEPGRNLDAFFAKMGARSPMR